MTKGLSVSRRHTFFDAQFLGSQFAGCRQPGWEWVTVSHFQPIRAPFTSRWPNEAAPPQSATAMVATKKLMKVQILSPVAFATNDGI
jgi:hypothetical protein